MTTVAGGGPNNLSAALSSIGYAVSVTQDALGNTYISDGYSNRVYEVSKATGILTVVAGNGARGYSGDGGAAVDASLASPGVVAVDGSGNLFIADSGNSIIREVEASTGIIQTVAGNGASGFGGDGGPATSAMLDGAYGVALDGQGNLYIADTNNCVIRKVTSGTISTIAGNPSLAQPCGYSGDGAAATSAQLDIPLAVTVDAQGNIYIADTYNSVIRVVNASTSAATIANVSIPAGAIATVAGSNYNSNIGSTCQFTGDGGAATAAYLCLPGGVFVDASGNIFIADTENFAIREVIPAGSISTLAGTLGTAGYTGDNAAATSATLNYPNAVFVDSSQNVLIADTENSAIREVASGTIQTVDGNGTLAYSGDGNSALNAALNFPGGAFVDTTGNIFIADTYSSVIREVLASDGTIHTVAGNGTYCSDTTNACGDGSAATSAQLNGPQGVFVDASGLIYIADTVNSAIRVVNPGSSAVTVAGVAVPAGAIETIAGKLGNQGYSGDGGVPTSATLYDPYGVSVDASGNIYVADTDNAAIRVINTGASTLQIGTVMIAPGAIQTIAGNGTACGDASTGCGDGGPASSAQLSAPSGLSVDASGNIFVADTFNNAIREINITTGTIQTVAGTLGQRGYSGDNAAPTSALLDTPFGVYVDSFGNLFVADTDNSAIREVVAVANTIQTVAGTGTPGFSGDGGFADSAQLNGPANVAAGPSGTLFIADTESSRIRKLTSTVSIALIPSAATVPLTGSQQFGANVSGSNIQTVTWEVNNIVGGNTTVGTISQVGLYQAPATEPSTSVMVSAIANGNGFTSGTAGITFAGAGAPIVTVNSNPSGVTSVYTGTTQAFTATVTGETNTAVDWSVNGTAGGNATVGTIATDGTYTAPSSVPSPAIVLITALSQADSTVSGSYPITIVVAPSVSQAPPQTISPGASANYSLSLDAHTGNPQQPLTLSCLQSSLPSGASCGFSPKAITPGSNAVPFTLTIKVPPGTASSASTTSENRRFPLYAVFLPLAGFVLLSGFSGKQQKREIEVVAIGILLLTLGACGGGSGSGSTSTSKNPELGTYSVQVQGATPGQTNPLNLTTVSLTVQ